MAYNNYGPGGGFGGGWEPPDQFQYGSNTAKNQNTTNPAPTPKPPTPPPQPATPSGGLPQGMNKKAQQYYHSLTPQQQQAALKSWGGDVHTANKWFQNAKAAGAVNYHQDQPGAPQGSNTIQTDPKKSLKEQGIAQNVNQNSGWNATGQDRTGMRAWARQHGMSEDFDRFDEGTLVRWEQFRDPNCPPKRPYRPDPDHMKNGMHINVPVSGCVEKPIDVPKEYSGYVGGGAGGGGAVGKMGGKGSGKGSGTGMKGGSGPGLNTPIYNYLEDSSFKAIEDPNEAFALLGMTGGVDEYQSYMDDARKKAMAVSDPETRARLLAELDVQGETGEVGLRQAAAGLARGDLKGLVNLEEQKRAFDEDLGFRYAGLGQDDRHFRLGLNQQDRHFNQDLGYRYAGLNQDDRHFGTQMDFNRWATEGGWTQNDKDRANALKLAEMGYDSQSGSWWKQGLGAGLGAGLGSFFDKIFTSDIRLKENITENDAPGLSALAAMPTYKFNYKPEVQDTPGARRGRTIGIMAQDVEKVIPEAVIDTPDGKKVDFVPLLATTMKAVTELQKKVESRKKRRTK